MHGRILVLIGDQQLFGVCFFAVRIAQLAVSYREKEKSDLFKIALTVVGDIPAQHMVTYFVVFMSLSLPFVGSEPRKRRQTEILRFDKLDVFFENSVYFRALHKKPLRYLFIVLR